MKKRFSDEQILNILKEGDAGIPVKDVCRMFDTINSRFSRILGVVPQRHAVQQLCI